MDTTISGSVTRSGTAITGAYVTAVSIGSKAVYGSTTDAAGHYTIHRLPAGTYNVWVQPYTSDRRLTLSPYYLGMAPANMDFFKSLVASNVTIVAGQAENGVNAAVSATASAPDPYEPDNTIAQAALIPPPMEPRRCTIRERRETLTGSNSRRRLVCTWYEPATREWLP